MPTQITNYQCPSCTGPLHFVAESGKLECDFCGGSFDVAEIEALYSAQNEKAQESFDAAGENAQATDTAWDMSGISDNWGADGQSMRVYNCPSCGAELITDVTTAATSCPYCGNNTIVPGQLGGALKPDYVIPFKLDKAAAKKALKNHYRGKIFLPRAFSSANKLEELKGIYVPFWLFNAEADADCFFHATREHAHQQGDYRVITTEHYEVRRRGTMSFEQIPTDASKKMADDYMDSIEPFDYSELKPFSAAYLPGYLADKYDVTAQDSAERADKRCHTSAVELLQDDITGYVTVEPRSSKVNLTRGKVQYALLPVWTLRTKWKDKEYLFMMNGQTGKLVGDLPVSSLKFWGLTGVLAAVVSFIASYVGLGQLLAECFFG